MACCMAVPHGASIRAGKQYEGVISEDGTDVYPKLNRHLSAAHIHLFKCGKSVWVLFLLLLYA